MGEENKQKKNGVEKNIEYYVEGDWLIFLDTCALIEIAKNKDMFWSKAVPILIQYGKRVIVPYSCYKELEKHAHGEKDEELADIAKKAQSTIAMLQNRQIDVFADENDGQFADKVLYRVISGVSVERKVLLITQDNNLAKDMLDLNNRRSIQSKKVEVRRVEKNGNLGRFYWKNQGDKERTHGTENGSQAHTRNQKGESNKHEENKERSKKGDNASENLHRVNKGIINAFRVCTVLTSIPEEERMSVSYEPKEGDVVYAVGRAGTESVKLIKKIGQGGEGAVYLIDKTTSYVAKIYKNEKNERRKYEKIRLLIENGISCEGICFPVALLYNASKEFVGYIMPIAKGKEMQRCIAGKKLIEKNYPSWSKIDTVQLCVTILKKIQYLQERNIIMGDINPSNILIVSPTEVYFVDTDSYQIEDLPCPVGTVNFTAPEIQGKNFNSFLRTKGNENFAIATLLFMILLPGKPPYSQQGGEEPGKNIQKMDFSYPLGLDTNKKTPEGPWRFIWSHLPYHIKECFFKTFKRGEEYSEESTRLSVDDWLHELESYLNNLRSGRIKQYDEMSEELFPTRFKKNKNRIYINCKICNSDQDEEYCKEGICSSCLKNGETYQCKSCGKTMIYTNYQKHIQKKRRYDVCYECMERGRQIRMTAVCIDCGRPFEITNNDYDFLISKGLSLPKRCKACRENKKNSLYTTKPMQTSSFSNSLYRSGSTFSNNEAGTKTKDSGWNGCFITTAVCKYMGKADDCDELVALRSFRDCWLRKQPDGQQLIEEYYASAPNIVQKMVDSAYYENYCELLWEEYILACVELIESKRYEMCKEKYVEMINRLKKLFEEEE